MKVPCSALATDESGTVVAAAHGNRLSVLRCDTDGRTQLLLSFDAPPTAAAPRATLRAVCVAASGAIVACGGDDKVLRVWDTAAPSLSAARPCPKRVTAVAIDAELHVVFSDKFGDVYRFADVSSSSSASTTTTKVDEDRECILGHMSMLTCMALSADGRLIATGDRDEKVRVSRFPAAYDIAAFCLGHTASVMGLVFLGERLLASGGSDGTLRLWHADTGAEACAPVHLAPATAAAADASAVVVPVGWHAATGALAVIVEGHTDVLIFDEHLVLRETLPTAAPPLSCAFVRGGHLLVALTDGSVIVLSPAGADAAAQRSSLFLADAIAGNAPEAESAEVAAALVADAWRGNMRRVKSAETDGDEDEGCHHAAKRKKKAEADQ